MGTMQNYASKIAVPRLATSNNAKFWQHEMELPTASNIRCAEKMFGHSKAQKAKHWRNQKITLCEMKKRSEKKHETQARKHRGLGAGAFGIGKSRGAGEVGEGSIDFDRI